MADEKSHAEKHFQTVNDTLFALDARLKALEAAQRPAEGLFIVQSDGIQYGPTVLAADSPAPAPADSLVQRVQAAISGEYVGTEARAAIREVAAWIREQGEWARLYAIVPSRLEAEADQ